MDINKLETKCPICEANAIPKFQAGDHQMFKCTSCYLSFVSPTPSDKFLNNFYSNFHKRSSEGGKYDDWENRVNLDFKKKIDKLKTLLNNQSQILDVGCGKGYFVKACNKYGLRAEGIDLSDTAIEYAKNTLGIDAICGRIEEHPELEAKYDAITFWATIEHVPDPIQTLMTIKKALKPGGYLFLDTGIGNDWLDKLLPGVNQWYDPPQHLYVFSKKSLIDSLSKAGFKTINVDSCFERSKIRQITRIIRGLSFAISLRIIEFILRTKNKNTFQFTRYPIGNLISVVAQVKD
jgi:SAM-dependent methyltransferase